MSDPYRGDDAPNAATYPDLGLTNDEVIARYLRQIDDGPECAAKLRGQGFDVWCQMWWDHHATAKARMAEVDPDGPPMNYEWDSRNYDVAAMREIFDGIIAHSSRKGWTWERRGKYAFPVRGGS